MKDKVYAFISKLSNYVAIKRKINVYVSCLRDISDGFHYAHTMKLSIDLIFAS